MIFRAVIAFAAMQLRAGTGFGWRRRPGRAVAARPSRVGITATPVAGPTPDGNTIEVGIRSEGRVVLAFLTSSCSTCRPVWAALATIPQPANLSVVAVTPSPSTESARAVRARRPPGLPVVMASEVWHAYGVTGAPWYVCVDGGVITAEGRLDTVAALTQLLLPPPETSA